MDKSKWEYRNFEKCIEKIPHPKQLKTSEYNSEGRYPIISQEETLISGYSDKQDIVNHFSKPVVIFGDHTRTLKYIDFDFIVGADGVKILIPKNDLIGKFLFYYLKWYKIPSLGYSRHYKLLKEISIPIPPLSIQQDIVSEFDQLSAIISLKQQQMKEYDALAQSLYRILIENTKRSCTIEEVCILKSGDSSANKSDVGTLPYVKVGDMNIDSNNPYIVTSSTFVDRDQNKKNIFPIGTTIFPKRGGAILTNKKRMTKVEICCDLNVMGVIPTEKIEPEYLFEYFLSLDFSKIINGSTIPQLNNKDIAPLIIPLPPLSLQRSFAEKVKAIEHQKSLLKQSIAETQTLLDSRMQEYFG